MGGGVVDEARCSWEGGGDERDEITSPLLKSLQ